MAKGGDKKLVIILIILFVVAFGVIAALCYYRYNANQKLKQDIESIKARIQQEEARKATIPKLQRQMRERIEAITQLTQILPTETEASHSEFLRLLRGFAQISGVNVTSLLPPTEIPQPEFKLKKYIYNILVTGTYPQFARFLNQIERHTRFLKLDNFEIANDRLGANYWPDKPDKKIKLQITTYTYKPD